jgi:hypothetical protein
MKYNNVNFAIILEDIYNKTVKKNIKYVHNQKYTIRNYIDELLIFIQNNVYWSRYKGKINGKLLNSKHNEFVKNNIYIQAYKELLSKYVPKNTNIKFKYLSTDTLFIKNKGIFLTRYNKINKNIGRNKLYKNKRGIKISTIVDSNGIPLNLDCFMGNSHDVKFFEKLYENKAYDTNILDNKKFKKKNYFLGDKAYDTKKVRHITDIHNTIIDYNKRKTKDNTKIKKLNSLEKKIYKKRIVVEHFFAWLTIFPKMNMIVEHTLESFIGLVFLCSSLILQKKIKYNI